MSILACSSVGVEHPGGVFALTGVDFEVSEGESVALLGRSGSGKTTLLHVLAGIVRPSSGVVDRSGSSSMVFQGANLLPHFSALENVRFVASAASDPERLLALVGLEGKLDQLPGELSGGEAQRVAVARSLGQEPDVLLCDEPTGHLDSDTGARVLDLIDALRAELGFGLVMATHDRTVAERCERTVVLSDGRVSNQRSL